MADRTVSPSSLGVPPRMNKVYDGRNVATRPIPLIVDESERRAILAAAADQRPKASSVNFDTSGLNAVQPNSSTAQSVFGTQIRSGGDVMATGVFNPLTGTDNFE